MAYIKNGVYPIHEWQIRAENPTISFPAPMQAAHVSGLGYFPVTETATPAYDPETHDAVEGAPALVADAWQQTWTIVEKVVVVPTAVTMRQARLALLAAGMLATVNSVIAAMPGAEGDAARIEWEYAHEVRRDAALVAGMATALNLTSEQLDALFIAAYAII